MFLGLDVWFDVWMPYFITCDKGLFNIEEFDISCIDLVDIPDGAVDVEVTVLMLFLSNRTLVKLADRLKLG